MIYSLKVTDSTRLSTPWWSKTESLGKLDVIEFGPGVNILWGRNASGKSTILELLAKWFHCYQGGRSLVTYTSMRDMEKGIGGIVLDGAEVKHDGQSVVYYNPEKIVGTAGGQFDDDFMEEGIQSIFMKGSSGEHTIHGIMRAVKQKPEETIPWNETKITHKSRAAFHSAMDATLASNSPSGHSTILLDEPDRSLDMDNAARLWDQLPKIPRKQRQLIVATHSPFALNIADAKYIELTPGYLEKCRELFRIGEKT